MIDPMNLFFQHIEQIRVLRTQKVGLTGTVVHSTDVTTVATPQATGNYVFTQIRTNASVIPKATSLFFYFESKSTCDNHSEKFATNDKLLLTTVEERKPFLMGTERIQQAKRKTGEAFITLPCVTAKVDIALYLYKKINVCSMLSMGFDLFNYLISIDLFVSRKHGAK